MGVNGIYGLSGSGMDIESMVKVGMMSKQNEYDKMAQKFTKNEWMKADYLELNSKITTFNASTLSQYKMSTTMNAKSATSSNDSVVTATVGSSAALMTRKVEVKSLSANAYLIGTNTDIKRYNITSTTASTDTSEKTKLANVIFSDLTTDTRGGKTYVGGHYATVNVTGLDSANTSDGNGNYKLNTSYAFGSSKGSDSYVSTDDVAFSFGISDGKTSGIVKFTYKELLDDGATFTDLVSKINNLGTNIRATYDVDRDQFTLYNRESGENNTIEITLDSPGGSSSTGSRPSIAARNFFNNMGFYQSANGKLTGENENASTVAVGDGNSKLFYLGQTEKVTGKNSKVVIDGVTYNESSNKISLGGITYTAASEGTATISVSQDTDAIIDKVKSFVNDYNTLLADLYKKYDEKPNSDYKPLTQSQKDQMKDEQIEKWEEKAKAGLLYHDQTLGKIIQNMRNAIAEGVELKDGSTVSVFSLGISTTGLKGQLVLDEDKLKKALANDSDIVYNVFSSLGDDLDNAKTSGVAQRLGDIFVDASKKIKTRAGSSSDITEDSDLNNLLRNLQTRMSNFKKMMSSFEDALYKKYDAMESTLAKLGTQLNYIMGGSA